MIFFYNRNSEGETGVGTVTAFEKEIEPPYLCPSPLSLLFSINNI